MAVGGIAVGVGASGVAVGGIAVGVGASGVAVGGIAVGVGASGVAVDGIAVGVGGSEVAVSAAGLQPPNTTTDPIATLTKRVTSLAFIEKSSFACLTSVQRTQWLVDCFPSCSFRSYYTIPPPVKQRKASTEALLP